jgi:diacylglycerol kinase family enzyme
MGTRAVDADPQEASPAQRWLARLALVAAAGAVVALLAGGRNSLVVLTVGVLGVAAALAGLWWFLSNQGVLRWVGATVAVAGPVAMTAFYVARGQLVPVLVVLLLATVAGTAARAATRNATATGPQETETPPPAHPFLIMNPRSGGGKVRRFGLDAKAAQLGADVRLLEGPERVDVSVLARDAAGAGADLLGVAGGDGTQALVAGIAAELDLPFLVLSAGTRNHFAMDLGLDREHPDAGLDALTDGVEVRIDLGRIGDRTFVNNASFGAYADIVQSPAYRDDKRGTTLQMLPDLLAGRRGAHLHVLVDDGVRIEAPQALLVSNNPYGTGDPAGLSRRARLDTGVLGVVAVTVDSAAKAAGLLGGRHAEGVTAITAHDVVVDADAPEIPVGIDGEAVMMPTPVRCTIEPGALRVRVPRHRAGIPEQSQRIDWALVRRRALHLRRLAWHDRHHGIDRRPRPSS